MALSVEIVLLAAFTCALSFILTNVVRSQALRHGLLDKPNARSSHSAPTPRGGGIAVIAAGMIGMATAVASGMSDVRETSTLAAGVLLIGVVGWLDDTRSLGARSRLAVHAAVAIGTMYMLRGLPRISVGNASIALGVAGYVLGVVGIVWSINLFNFMDGIDGLAGSQATLIFATGGFLLYVAGESSLATTAAVLAAASAGFLAWNWPPAKIFLGDVGSGAIGYAVAGIAIASENHHSVPLLSFAIIGGVFIADATVTLLRRLRRGHSPSEAHRDHAYQRLARQWGSHRRVTLAAGATTCVFALLGAAGSIWPQLLLPAFVLTGLTLAILVFAAEQRTPM